MLNEVEQPLKPINIQSPLILFPVSNGGRMTSYKLYTVSNSSVYLVWKLHKLHKFSIWSSRKEPQERMFHLFHTMHCQCIDE